MGARKAQRLQAHTVGSPGETATADASFFAVSFTRATSVLPLPRKGKVWIWKKFSHRGSHSRGHPRNFGGPKEIKCRSVSPAAGKSHAPAGNRRPIGT